MYNGLVPPERKLVRELARLLTALSAKDEPAGGFWHHVVSARRQLFQHGKQGLNLFRVFGMEPRLHGVAFKVVKS